MEKLADNLQRLGEEDLLQVVEMVHNNKTADTYTKNDVERMTDSLPFGICLEKADKPGRGRISRGPLHPTRQPRAYALGLLRGEVGRLIFTALRPSTVRRL